MLLDMGTIDSVKFGIFKLVVAAIVASVAVSSSAAPSAILVDEFGVAAKGHDVVAYFDNRVTRGVPDYEVEYRGAIWYFESAANATKFQRNPERYEPVYGGYCAYGVSQGYLVPTDPSAWSVVNGKLYLNYNATTRNRWLSDRENYILIADKHWPRLIR